MPDHRALQRPADDGFERFLRYARALGSFDRGHHNLNYMVRPLTEQDSALVAVDDGAAVTVRQRIPSALPVVIRTWQDEPEILNRIRGILPHVPRCHAKYQDIAVLSYVEGVPLSSICPGGTPLDPGVITALAGLLADMTQVGRRHLPPLPVSWPRSSRDGRAFLRALAFAAEEQIRARNWAQFGGLFAMLGIPEDAMVRFAERVPALISRPFSLLHTDLHRDNVIVSFHGDPPLICVDWELATYGDPLHDLATHLVRMQYPGHQWDEVVEAWRTVMGERRSKAVHGLDRDLKHYLAFEHAQSVYPDVMRAAESLGDSFDQRELDAATQAVHRALLAAQEPLRLKHVPDERAIERILFRWNESHGVRPSRERTMFQIVWERDRRVPIRPDFPPWAVSRALFEEGAASADRVFKGTAHLNTAVRVAGVAFPVMVRRRAGSSSPLERRFLNEHVVLGAIEQTGVRVRAPRVLALGTSGLREQFTVHTYEGPVDGIRPPAHPEYGLLPHEADDLVDQLAELTHVPCDRFAPDFGEMDFYSWLRAELVRMVGELPTDTRDLARELGLPDSVRLDEILTRHILAPRRSVLLHGDLNPWNLVRRADGGLTLIDWEMAMIGDPLYDLVRHMHLTPTRPDIRRRLLDRWSRRLPDDCTKGWQEDWRVYRWIEIIRSAYVDLDRLVTGDSLEAPNVRRAVDAYAMTLVEATAALGLPDRSAVNPYLVRALPRGGHRAGAVTVDT
ncbi:phosphotransferase [Streptomyces sp. DSM 41699]|uniref:Phosphotransferase n=2 Tax=Streptomyces gibsoniae TaxID=3075529 RepID=A0ABU2TRG1_9ACTN|nr:phosphotransferase [Streptomyces sp. DSM 41699]MDT0463511.1 phosphotransferase [Streptomyces sp. DSM 41699]